MASELAVSESGEAFIHAALERTVSDGGLSDALFIIDDERSGRRVFRAGWQPAEQYPDRAVVARGSVGLHTVPAVSPEFSEAFTCMCRAAMRIESLAHDASHDDLTGLFNRRSFESHLNQALARADRYGWKFGLALLDLDRFKSLNDQFGHHYGDVVLRAVGSELGYSLRAGDVAARTGGDEFGLILVDATPELLSSVLDRVHRALRTRLPSVTIGISAGLAVAPTDGCQPDALYRIADHRLYAAKRG